MRIMYYGRRLMYVSNPLSFTPKPPFPTPHFQQNKYISCLYFTPLIIFNLLAFSLLELAKCQSKPKLGPWVDQSKHQDFEKPSIK